MTLLTIEQWIEKLSSPDKSPSVLFCHYYRFASINLHFPNHQSGTNISLFPLISSQPSQIRLGNRSQRNNLSGKLDKSGRSFDLLLGKLSLVSYENIYLISIVIYNWKGKTKSGVFAIDWCKLSTRAENCLASILRHWPREFNFLHLCIHILMGEIYTLTHKLKNNVLARQFTMEKYK